MMPVMRMAEFYDRYNLQKSNVDTGQITNEQPPDLRFTKVLRACFGNRPVNNWNGLLREALIQAWRHKKDFDSLRRTTAANIVQGNRTDCGFKHIPEIDISYQGVDAESAWVLSKSIAQRINTPLEVHFVWRNKESAEHPGETGVLKWVPESN